MKTDKQIIYDDGIDFATVEMLAPKGNEIVFTVDGVTYSAIAEEFMPPRYPNGHTLLEISCDTPNMTIVVTQGDELIIIYSAGVP